MPRLLLALILCTFMPVHAADTFTFSNAAGPHAVGVKVVQQYDRTRRYKMPTDLVTGEPAQGERARPVQTLIWYPADRGGTPVTFRDYLETMTTEDEFARSAADVKRLTQIRIGNNAGSRRAALLRDIDGPMQAVRNARARAGKFPVVIYAPSFSASAVENADLCENLASHGYVVLSSPSLGVHTRAMTADLEGLEAQAGDIAYLIGYAYSLPQADADNVAVVGFSWGGLANVLAAAKDERIKAIVSLDGSVRGTREFVDGGKDAAKYVTPARVAIPMLFVGRRPATVEELNRAQVDTRYSFMNEMKYSDVYLVSMLPMKHMDFSSYQLRMAPDDSFGDHTRDDIALAHSWAVRYVRHFLDAKLKHDAAGLAFIDNTPHANRAPAHMMIADIRRSTGGLAPTLENFVVQLAKSGFDQAVPLYDKMAAQTATFKLGPDKIYGWASQLASIERPHQALEIFRLGTHLHPDDSDMLDGLAEMQARTGQTQQAIRSYRRVLELDPKSFDAAKYLKEQGAAQAGAAP